VSLLIARGAKPDIEARDGMTPLRRAATSNHYEVVRVLLEAGVDPRGPQSKKPPNDWMRGSATYQAGSPLKLAINNGHSEAVAEAFEVLEA